MVSDGVGVRPGEEQTDGFIRTALQDERTGVARLAEGMPVRADDDDLFLENKIARVIADGHVGVNALDVANGVTGGAAEFVHRHVDGRIGRAGRRADVKHIFGNQFVAGHFGDRAIDFVSRSEQRDELGERCDLVRVDVTAVE